MKCFDCKTQIDDAIGYRGRILCYPCYDLWYKTEATSTGKELV